MKRKIKVWAATLTLLTSVSGVSAKEADWFVDSLLQATYTALAQNQPLLAWQELQLALHPPQLSQLSRLKAAATPRPASLKPPAPRHWLPVKAVILSQTDCGRQLHQGPALPARLQVDFISKSGASDLGYQIKLAAESVNQTMTIRLLGPGNKTLLSARFSPQAQYAEAESEEFLTPPAPGLYQLVINDHPYPLIIAGLSDNPWLQLENTASPRLKLDLPPSQRGCAPAFAHWQWFDDQYNLVGPRQPVIASGAEPIAELPATILPKAVRLSAAVSQYEYQSGIKVAYIQRIALPFPAWQQNAANSANVR
ncbi:DUF2861 family protein [Photobacterium sp. TY1-4]|uniref:DUF2861 family protein n=1 Tax=Photobacterium sp. TY1-4 TaxID=2899122 RepID=UPI0021C0F605|nr:DUF2861 family protein [Photobacterium sp. TY1-4]UXI03092.1 DUF2861 family protein [Photobacterium sp. TY1-4]